MKSVPSAASEHALAFALRAAINEARMRVKSAGMSSFVLGGGAIEGGVDLWEKKLKIGLYLWIEGWIDLA